jgi:hypothetical protein
MQSHMLLMREVLAEAGTRCCTSTTRDLTTITRRYENEGMSFLTISLPKFCDDFQKSLAEGRVSSTAFQGYRKTGCLPRFLRGFTSLVFDRNSGVLLDKPNIEAIASIRQVTLLFGKILLPCSDAREKAAMSKYVECEQQVRESDAKLSLPDQADFLRVFTLLFGNVLNSVSRDIYEGEIVPKHGPGSTADKLSGNAKYNQRLWTRRLEEVPFYAGEFLFPNWSHYDYDSPPITWLDPGDEIPVKVISVPKTLKTPRIIAIEPTCMQYVQQGLMESVTRWIARDDLLASMIDFKDGQARNRELALKGSSTGAYATLDLSEASDRVSNQLVRLATTHYPWVTRAFDASRSRKADVPGHGVIRLAKFASMGSALTFPVETMVFLAIVFLGIEREQCTPLTPEGVEAFRGEVRIFGDDIVVAKEYVQSVIKMLTTFGLVVNLNKSFWTGKFRESCGGDYYDGEDVSLVRVRRNLPTSQRHVPEIISAVALRNQMYYAGYWKVAAYLDTYLGKLIPFPTVGPDSPALGRHSYLGHESQKECRYLHKSLVWAFTESSKSPRDHLEGPGALLKFFLKRSAEPSVDKDHLERAGRPKAVNIKPGWVSAT